MAEKFDFYDKTSLKSYNLDESMRYQLKMLDSLDVFTRLHCENVASISCRICEYLHMNKGFTIYCTICAYLHDIGKLLIPPKILQKPGKLTDEEYAIMKTHTTLGYKMCMEDLQLRPYAEGAKSHHEALDGSGYPEGLKGNEVPYVAQIIRVADEYDAISSKRQYKSHIGISDTLKIIHDETIPREQNSDLSDTMKFLHDEAKPKKGSKYGKVDKKIVKALTKVVIDDTEYEISQLFNYVEDLKSNVDRLEQAQKYYNSMLEAKKDSKREYFEQGVKMLLKKDETMENFRQVLVEYKEIYAIKKEKIDLLYEEIKKIKKLK